MSFKFEVKLLVNLNASFTITILKLLPDYFMRIESGRSSLDLFLTIFTFLSQQ